MVSFLCSLGAGQLYRTNIKQAGPIRIIIRTRKKKHNTTNLWPSFLYPLLFSPSVKFLSLFLFLLLFFKAYPFNGNTRAKKKKVKQECLGWFVGSLNSTQSPVALHYCSIVCVFVCAPLFLIFASLAFIITTPPSLFTINVLPLFHLLSQRIARS